MLLQKHCGTNGSHTVIQMDGVYTTLKQEQGTLLQKYGGRNGKSIVLLFKSSTVRGLCDS